MTVSLKRFWFYLPFVVQLFVTNNLHAGVGEHTGMLLMTEIPMNVMATAQSSNSIEITWDDVVDDNGYIIQISTDMTTGFVEKGQVEIDGTSFTATNLANHSTEYFFRVAAIGTPNSEWSAVVSATTNEPESPTNLVTGTITAIAVELNWDDNTSFEIGYRIERSDDLGTSFKFVGNTDMDITTFTDMGLSGSTTYQYKVAGRLGTVPSDTTDFSNILQVMTSAPVVPNGVPTALTTVVLSTSEIRLNWVDNSTNETGFSIERSDFIDGLYKEVDQVEEDVVTYTSTDLEAGSKYFFRIVAFNDEGKSNPSSSVSSTTEVAAPIAPTDLEATEVSPNGISIEWVDNATSEDGYDVQIATGATFISVAKLEADVESFAITNLAEATIYSIKVLAFNSTGETASSVIKVTTSQEAPEAPTDLTFAINDTGDEIELSWVDNSDNEEIFSIERSVGDTENFEELDDVESDLTSFTDQIEIGINHFYRVRAINGGGESDYTNIIGNVLASSNSGIVSEILSLYPNPSSGIVYLDLNRDSDIKRIRIYDYTGRLFGNLDQFDRNANQVVIDLSNKPNGLYVIEIEVSGSILQRKVLLRR